MAIKKEETGIKVPDFLGLDELSAKKTGIAAKGAEKSAAKSKEIPENEIDIAQLKKRISSRKRSEQGKQAISIKTGRIIEKKPVEEPEEKESAEEKRKSAQTSDSKSKKGIQRISTGISGLDDEIEGGFVRDSVVLVAGPPGSGKSILAMQFLMDGIKKKEAGIYISFEEEKDAFYESMSRFDWDIEGSENKGLFKFIKYTPSQVKDLLEEGGGLIENEIEKTDAKRVVIDSITAFTLLYENEHARRGALLSLFELLGKLDCTVIVTAEQESEPEKHIYSVEEFEVDGVILLYNLRKGNLRQRIVEILKMRATKFDNKIFPMKITNEGIVFYPSEEVF